MPYPVASARGKSRPPTVAAAPGQVQNLTATHAGTGAINLSWDALAGATSYRVQIAHHNLPGPGDWSDVNTPSQPQAGTTAACTGLSAFIQFDFQVRGESAGGNGAYSATATATA